MTAKRSTRNQQRLVLFLGGISLLLVIGSYRQHTRLVDHAGRATRHLDQMGPLTFEDNQRPQRAIYSQLRKDQAGWVIFDMLKAHSYAFSHNKIYGGACGDSAHKDDIQEVLTSVGWKDVLPLACPGENESQRVYASSFFEKKHGRRMGSSAWRGFIQNRTDYSYFGGAHSSLASDPAKAPFSIVVHIRRRDVTPCCYPNWYLTNTYFASMIEKYRREQEPGRPVEVQIFSQSDSYETFDYFLGKNYTLHLDGNVGGVWRAILSADVFIGSISEFSRVPALFAKGEIPNPRNISDPNLAAQSKAGTQKLLDQCSDVQLVQCKHQWWMDSSSSFQRRPKK